jgi:fructokinase
MVMAVCDEKGTVLDKASIPTQGPEETLEHIVAYFKKHDVQTLGVGAFGPVDLNFSSPTFGNILNTPKLAWQNVPLLKTLKEGTGVPVVLDTDVNAALYGEVVLGNAKGIDHAAYITVGTGIGIGLWLNGRLYHGSLHSEGGHMRVARYPGDTFAGNCPFHKDCLEGLAAGPALLKRYNVEKPEEIWKQEGSMDLESHYIAEAITDLTMLLSLQRVILGGGVCDTPGLMDRIREKTAEKLGDYLPRPDKNQMDQFILPAALYPNQGIVGAAMLGRDFSSI